MLGCIIGDIVGSIYEFDNIKTKEFPLFEDRMEYTDDSVLAIATADWLLSGGDVAHYYAKYANDYPYPMGGYGTYFKRWAIRYSRDGQQEPYGSCGNGSAMRITPVGWAFETESDVLESAKKSSECTHNHPEGIKGAQAVALCIFLARHGLSKSEIKERLENDFGYDLSMTVDEIRPRYSWHGLDNAGNGGTCQGSVPQAIICALDSTNFEDAIRNAISIGGDSDTIGCITGGIAEALYGIPQRFYDKALGYLSPELKKIILTFETKFGNNIIL